MQTFSQVRNRPVRLHRENCDEFGQINRFERLKTLTLGSFGLEAVYPWSIGVRDDLESQILF